MNLIRERQKEREEMKSYIKEKKQIETEAYRKTMIEKAGEIGVLKAETKIEEQKKVAQGEKKHGLLGAFDDLTIAAANFDMNKIDTDKEHSEKKKDGEITTENVNKILDLF
jgi:uncharacterized protein YfeS